MIGGNVLLFKDIKISLGLLITAWKMHALFLQLLLTLFQQLQII